MAILLRHRRGSSEGGRFKHAPAPDLVMDGPLLTLDIPSPFTSVDGFGPAVDPDDWRRAVWAPSEDGDDEIAYIYDGHGNRAECSVWPAGGGWEWEATWDWGGDGAGSGAVITGTADTREQAREQAALAVPRACSAWVQPVAIR